jgi:hypothetical protein
MRDFKTRAASQSLDAAAAYAARGRPHRELSDALLADKWTAAFRSTVQHPERADLRELERDLSSEHKLRGRQLPYEAVAAHRKLLISQILAEYERSLDSLKGVASGVGRASRDLKRLRAH